MTLLTENVCHAPDNTILEPDLLPPKGPGQGAPHLKGICRKKTLDSPLWTPLDPRSSMSRRYEGNNWKQLITTNLSITTPDRNPFQPKPRILKWSTMQKKNKTKKNIRQGNQENANLKYASLLRLVSPCYTKTIPSKTELEHDEWKTLV